MNQRMSKAYILVAVLAAIGAGMLLYGLYGITLIYAVIIALFALLILA